LNTRRSSISLPVSQQISWLVSGCFVASLGGVAWSYKWLHGGRAEQIDRMDKRSCVCVVSFGQSMQDVVNI